ncbi:MAG: DsbA family protein [Rhizobiaceae bacterium]
MKTEMNRRQFIASTTMAGVATMAFPMGATQAQTFRGLYDNIPLADEILGDVNAPVTLLEYASMTCPHCKRFHEEIMPGIKKSFIDTGKVKYILRPFPFDGDRRGEAAFMLAKCAPNDSYYPMLDALFATQKSWAGEGNPVPELLRISKLSGMTEADFKACLGDQELLTKMIQGRNLAVSEFKVRATPTVFINDQKFTGPSSVESLSEALNDALGN